MGKREKTWILIGLMVLSILAGCILSKPAAYGRILQSIDEKSQNVLALTGGVVMASAALTLLPDDIGTPIAQQLAEYTDYLLVIFSLLLAEKYLVTVFAAVLFFVLLPMALLASIPDLARRHPRIPIALRRITLVFLAVYLVVPASVGVCKMIEDTYQVSMEEAIAAVEELGGTGKESGAENSESLWNKITGSVGTAIDNVSGIPQKAAAAVDSLVQALALMLITSCIIPLVVLLLALYCIRLLTGFEPRHPRPRFKAPADGWTEENPLHP